MSKRSTIEKFIKGLKCSNITEYSRLSPLLRARLENTDEYEIAERRSLFIADAKRRIFDWGIPGLPYRTGRSLLRQLSKGAAAAEYYEPVGFTLPGRKKWGTEGEKHRRKFEKMYDEMRAGTYKPQNKKGEGKKAKMRKK